MSHVRLTVTKRMQWCLLIIQTSLAHVRFPKANRIKMFIQVTMSRNYFCHILIFLLLSATSPLALFPYNGGGREPPRMKDMAPNLLPRYVLCPTSVTPITLSITLSRGLVLGLPCLHLLEPESLLHSFPIHFGGQVGVRTDINRS